MSSFRTLVVIVTLISMMIVGTHGAYQSPVGGAAGSLQPVCYSHWQSVGPFHVAHRYDGINELTDPEDIGAVQDVIVVGTKAYAASVNGGIWRTADITSTSTFYGPHWESVTGHMPCTSMSSVAVSPDDSNLLVAGCGFPSNSASRGSEPLGAMISHDGGDTWTMTNFPKGFWITTVLVSGSAAVGSTVRIIISARQPIFPYSGTTGSTVDAYGVGPALSGGIWYSSDGGATFTQSNVAQSVVSMVPHSTTAGTYYAGIKYASGTAGSFPSNPVLVSTDYGQTWSPTVLGPPVGSGTTCSSMTTIVNTKLSMSGSNLFVGFALTDGSSSHCYCFYYTPDGGLTWTEIPNGAYSARDLGSQGASHFAILAAPTDSTTLFVAGTGSLVFRVSTSNNVWTIISTISVYAPNIEAPLYPTTSNSTAPHSGARTFCWDVNTDSLLLTNDGGVYKRTTPFSATQAGDWSSLAGDMAITEGYQVAVDPVSGAQMLAAQDNSVMFSQFDDTEKTTGIWNYLLTGDGSGALIDTSVSPAQFYGGDQYMSGLFKIGVNANSGGAGVSVVSNEFPISTTFDGCSMGSSSCLSFLTGLTVNSVTPSNLLICSVTVGGSTNSKCYKIVYTTTTQTVTELEFFSGNYAYAPIGTYYVESYVFGGRKDGVANENVVMAVSRGFVWSRSTSCVAAPGTFCATPYSGSCGSGCSPSNMVNIQPPWKNGFSKCRLAQHPQDYYINSIADDAGHIWLTTDFGQTWRDLNLVANSNLLSVTGHTTVDTFLTGVVSWVDVNISGIRPFIVGVGNGFFVSFDDPTAPYFTFAKFGANQPISASTTLLYIATQDTLIASVFGRGIWALQNATSVLRTAYVGGGTTTLNSACTKPLYPNVPNSYGFIAGGVSPAPIGFPGSTSATSSSSSSSSSTGSVATLSSSTDSTGASAISSTGGASSSSSGTSSNATDLSSSSSTAGGGAATSSGSAGSTGGSTAGSASSTGDSNLLASSSSGDSSTSTGVAVASASSDNTVRNAIIGGCVSGGIGLLFFLVRLFIQHRADKTINALTESGSEAAKLQAKLKKEIIRPLVQKLFAQVSTVGLIGYRSSEDTNSYIESMLHIVAKLTTYGIEFNLDTQDSKVLLNQIHLMNEIILVTKLVACPKRSCLARFFFAELTPKKLAKCEDDIVSGVVSRVQHSAKRQSIEMGILSPGTTIVSPSDGATHFKISHGLDRDDRPNTSPSSAAVEPIAIIDIND